MLSILLTEIAEIIDVIASFFRRLVRWRLTVEAKPGRQLLTFDRYLVLCVYDRTPRPDLLALIRQFKTAGFGIVLATSNDAYRQYQSLADAIVRVAPVGRDFTA